MKAKTLLGVLWGEAVSTAVYLLNRSSCKAIGRRTPYELWNGRTPSVQHLRTFGCIAHTKVNTPHQKKFNDRSCRMVFVGYEPGSKAYQVYDPSTRRVHISRDVVFDEAAAWAWSAMDPTERNDFTVQELDHQEPSMIITTRTTTEASPVASTASPASSVASPAPSGVGMSPALGASMAGSPAAPLCFRRIDNVLGGAETPELAHRVLEERLLLASDAEPASFEEVVRHECWRLAMVDEMTSIEASGTWKLVEPPAHTRPIGLKWVFKAKKDAASIVTKHKAHLVAKGYVQR